MTREVAADVVVQLFPTDFVLDAAEWVTFIIAALPRASYPPLPLLGPIVNLFVVLLGHDDVLRNTALVARLVTALHTLATTEQAAHEAAADNLMLASSPVHDMLLRQQLVIRELLPALAQAFVAMETMQGWDADSSDYSKPSVQHKIACLMNLLWQHGASDSRGRQGHLETRATESFIHSTLTRHAGGPRLLHFVSDLLLSTTFHFNDGLRKLRQALTIEARCSAHTHAQCHNHTPTHQPASPWNDVVRACVVAGWGLQQEQRGCVGLEG